MINDIVILIPVYQPDDKLVRLIGLLCRDFSHIVIVDDGSTIGREVFQKITDQVDFILEHSINIGKGAALKTGFARIKEAYPDIAGVVTADADGQHRVEDIIKIARKLQEVDDGLVLGVRTFSEGVPFRSWWGNLWTRWLFFIVAHILVRDTQTGLRGIPRSLLPRMLELEGDRYEYEMRMLADSRNYATHPVQIPIETIYIENNATSHFKPLLDTIRIYGALFRFCIVSVLSFVMDISLFALVIWIMGKRDTILREDVAVAACVSRFVSSNFNYLCNRFFVFHAKRGGNSFLKYWMLVLVILACSYGATELVSELCGAKGQLVTVVKVFVDTALFVTSYFLQKRWIFSRKQKPGDCHDGMDK